MSKYSECVCRVCEQKRLAAFEVDKLKNMMVKPLSADHETQYVASNRKVDAKLIEDLQARILKQDKQFSDLVNGAMKERNALIDVIEKLKGQLKFAENESEFWRLRAERNATPVGGVPVTIKHHIDFAAVTTVDSVAMRKAVQHLKSAFPLNGGCV
jgi:hypothetical protein